MVAVWRVAVMIVPPLVLLASGGPPGGVWREWFAKGLVVLVIACPCALVIATPVAVVSALASAARRGVLIKGGQFLEEFGRLRVLAFDKTGTLTRGEPDVVEVVSAEGRAGEDVLRIAAALGDRGGHVLGRAIARHARGLRLDVPVADDYTAVPGLGASGQRRGDRSTTSAAIATSTRRGCARPSSTRRFGKAEGDIGTSVALTAAVGPAGLDPPGRPGPARGRRGAGRAERAGRRDGHADRRQPADGRGHGAGAGHHRAAPGAAARPTRPRPSPSSTPGAARPAWSATGSTTPRPWPPPASASPWGASPAGPRWRRPTSS